MINLDWARASWRPTNYAKKNPCSGSHGDGKQQRRCTPWITRCIDTWNAKFRVPDGVANLLRDGLRPHGVLGDTWLGGSVNSVLSFSAKKEMGHHQIRLMADDDESTALVWDRYSAGQYPLAYDGLLNDSPQPRTRRLGVQAREIGRR